MAQRLASSVREFTATLSYQPPTLIFSSNDGQDSKRRRHHSGVSTGDLDEHEEVFTELPSAVEIFSGSFSWDLDTKQVYLKDINVKFPMGKQFHIVNIDKSPKSCLITIHRSSNIRSISSWYNNSQWAMNLLVLISVISLLHTRDCARHI